MMRRALNKKVLLRLCEDRGQFSIPDGQEQILEAAPSQACGQVQALS